MTCVHVRQVPLRVDDRTVKPKKAINRSLCHAMRSTGDVRVANLETQGTAKRSFVCTTSLKLMVNENLLLGAALELASHLQSTIRGPHLALEIS